MICSPTDVPPNCQASGLVTLRRVDGTHAALRATRLLLWVLVLFGSIGPLRAEGATGEWVRAYAAFGEPKYPKNFSHFDYVNPDAPKGGAIHLRNPDRRTSFDKFNYFTIQRQCAGWHGHLHARDARRARRPTSRERCTACWPRRCASSRT